MMILNTADQDEGFQKDTEQPPPRPWVYTKDFTNCLLFSYRKKSLFGD